MRAVSVHLRSFFCLFIACTFAISKHGVGRLVLIAMAARQLSFERPYPWEAARGSTRQRTREVLGEAQRVYAQQQALLPALRQEREADPEAAAHLHDVGRRALILRDHAAVPRKAARAAAQASAAKRVVPSRFPEIDAVDDAGQDESDDAIDGRIVRWNRVDAFGSLVALMNEVLCCRRRC